MAFTTTVSQPADVFGNKKHVFGTYLSDSGSTGGAIVTGLSKVYTFSDAVTTATPSTVVSISGGTVTITTTANQGGRWQATGV